MLDTKKKACKRVDCVPEQELAVQIRDVDGVHVNDMNIRKARQGQVLEDFTSETASTNDENLCVLDKVFNLQVRVMRVSSFVITRWWWRMVGWEFFLVPARVARIQDE